MLGSAPWETNHVNLQYITSSYYSYITLWILSCRRCSCALKQHLNISHISFCLFIFRRRHIAAIRVAYPEQFHKHKVDFITPVVYKEKPNCVFCLSHLHLCQLSIVSDSCEMYVYENSTWDFPFGTAITNVVYGNWNLDV